MRVGLTGSTYSTCREDFQLDKTYLCVILPEHRLSSLSVLRRLRAVVQSLNERLVTSPPHTDTHTHRRTRIRTMNHIQSSRLSARPSILRHTPICQSVLFNWQWAHSMAVPFRGVTARTGEGGLQNHQRRKN